MFTTGNTAGNASPSPRLNGGEFALIANLMRSMRSGR